MTLRTRDLQPAAFIVVAIRQGVIALAPQRRSLRLLPVFDIPGSPTDVRDVIERNQPARGSVVVLPRHSERLAEAPPMQDQVRLICVDDLSGVVEADIADVPPSS